MSLDDVIDDVIDVVIIDDVINDVIDVVIIDDVIEECFQTAAYGRWKTLGRPGQ